MDFSPNAVCTKNKGKKVRKQGLWANLVVKNITCFRQMKEKEKRNLISAFPCKNRFTLVKGTRVQSSKVFGQEPDLGLYLGVRTCETHG